MTSLSAQTREIKVGPVEMFVRSSSTQLDKKQFNELIEWQGRLAIFLMTETGETITLPE